MDLLKHLVNVHPLHIMKVTKKLLISGNCSAITSLGFNWPETPRNSTAIYTCPNNPDFSVTRECNAEGVWQNFDEQRCGMLAEELEMITMTTQDVCIFPGPFHIHDHIICS